MTAVPSSGTTAAEDEWEPVCCEQPHCPHEDIDEDPLTGDRQCSDCGAFTDCQGRYL